MNRKIYLSYFIIVSICLVCFLPIKSFALSDKIYKDIATFTRVLDIVDQYYVEEADEETLMEGAIGGMLNSLDPHTLYLSPEDFKAFSSDTRGRFGGVGIEVSVRDGMLTVISPLEGTPAWDAGIRAGDKIIAIDGNATKRMTLSQAVKLMRGSIGRKITLTLWREGKKKTKTISLVRRLIHVPAIKTEDLGDGYVLLRINTFQEGVAKNLKKSLDDFIKANKKIKGLILDLRDNPGGLLSEAVRISDFFLNDGVIVSTKGRFKDAEIKKAHSLGTYPDFPMIVLINEGSASASEIVAGALGDHRRAKLVGTKSYGKGSVQTLVNLDNGGAVKITIAHYFTPKNHMIDGKGINPDVNLDTKGYIRKNKIKKTKTDPNKSIERDEFYKYQRDEALKYLKRMARK
ncbi:MAG: S41 family peptidase [bacterium]|nr:S41 family peptidase [bacterium]MBU1917440.1 S41 family peptidase [bacterium]